MGSSLAQAFKQTQFNTSQLKHFRNSTLGKHYRNKMTKQQYLLIQITMDPGTESDSSFSILSQHLRQRITKKKKNIPEILQFRSNPQQLCSFPSSAIWMKHPSRSLAQEMTERKHMDECFAEGEIWMIVYGSVNAMLSYESLGFCVTLVSDNIFISENGDILVSDASLYSLFRLFSGPKRFKEPTENIKNLHQLMSELTQNLNQKYSDQLLRLIHLLRDPQVNSYRKLMSLILSLKTDLQHQKRSMAMAKQKQWERQNIIQHVVSEVVECSETEHAEEHKQNTKKFYRTTPILRYAREPLMDHLSLTTNIGGYQKYWTDVDISSITQGTKESRSDQSSLNVVNRLFDAQCSHPVDETKALWIRNKQSLQKLILNERNIILQVPQSQIDLSSARSKMSQSINASIRTFTITHNESTGMP